MSIIKLDELLKISELKKAGKTIVLVGGSFDILHKGHIEFLKKAGAQADYLIVLLESDKKIKKIKGGNRPVNTQSDRAAVLSNLPFVSYVYPLPYMENDKDYEILVKMLQPDIIALSGSDKVYHWEEELAKSGNLKIVKVIDRIGRHSTTNLVQRLNKS